jgi:hypothetical protein
MWGGVKVLLALVVLEGLLRLGFVWALPGMSLDCELRDEAWKRLVVAYRHRHGEPIQMPGRGWTHDARRGFKLAPGLEGAEVSSGHASSREAGIRGGREIRRPKPEGTTRVLALGDSFTFGDGVDDAETWPAQLDEQLGERVEVLNLGASAYAHDQMLLALLDDGLALDPDVVVLGFFASDLRRNGYTHYCTEKPRFVPEGVGLRLENVPVPDLEELARRHHDAPLIGQAARVLWGRLTGPPTPPDEGVVARRILARMREACEARGVRFAMVYLAGHGDPTLARTDGFFHRACRATETPCADTRPAHARLVAEAGRARFKAEHFLDDLHYTAAGNRVAAEVVAEMLWARGWVPR